MSRWLSPIVPSASNNTNYTQDDTTAMRAWTFRTAQGAFSSEEAHSTEILVWARARNFVNIQFFSVRSVVMTIAPHKFGSHREAMVSRLIHHRAWTIFTSGSFRSPELSIIFLIWRRVDRFSWRAGDWWFGVINLVIWSLGACGEPCRW